MGCFESKSSSSWSRDIRLKSKDRHQGYTVLMNYDFFSTGDPNDKKPEFTYQMRLWRDLTNPMGDPIDADSLKRIIYQLKKFLFLAA